MQAGRLVRGTDPIRLVSDSPQQSERVNRRRCWKSWRKRDARRRRQRHRRRQRCARRRAMGEGIPYRGGRHAIHTVHRGTGAGSGLPRILSAQWSRGPICRLRRSPGGVDNLPRGNSDRRRRRSRGYDHGETAHTHASQRDLSLQTGRGVGIRVPDPSYMTLRRGDESPARSVRGQCSTIWTP